jgi:hypothetical protein
MAISTLSKLTVPLATDASSSAQGLLMPKLKYRFRVILQGFGANGTTSTELTKQVMDVTRPKINFEEIEVPVYNSRIYLAGRHNWEPMTLNVRDDASGSIQRLCGEQIQKQFDFFEQSGAASGQDYKFTTLIEVLDGGNGAQTPNVLETFECYGCFVQNIDYGDLNYTSNEPATVNMSIRYDNAIQYKGGGVDGIGRNIGARTIGTLTTGGGNV